MKKLMKYLKISIICSVFLLYGCSSGRNKIIIAVASSSQHALAEIIDSMPNVEIVAGPSGQLTTQILEDAPFDIFIPASKDYVDTILEEFSKSRSYKFTECSLSLWIGDSSNNKTAIADPKIAPFGKLAKPHISNHDKVVLGTSISQVNSYIMQGSVGKAYTSNSSRYYLQEKGLRKGVWKSFPNETIEQCIIQLNGDRHVTHIVTKLQNDRSRVILRKHGYEPKF